MRVLMTEIKLSERLKQLVDWIEAGAIIADIGSDHAYLPTYAIQQGKIKKAIAGEVNQGPYESAKETVDLYGLSDQVEVRKGDGLQVLRPGEVDTIVIAGMGGSLIRKILDTGKELLNLDLPRLILQPNNGEEALRRWLNDHNWELKNEVILEEDGHIYEAVLAEKNGRAQHLTEEELLFGPFLRQEKSAVFKKKWQKELEKWQAIENDIVLQADQAADDLEEKLRTIRIKIQRIKEVIE